MSVPSSTATTTTSMSSSSLQRPPSTQATMSNDSARLTLKATHSHILSPAALKERRPSFAASSSPRIVDISAYSFRDDTQLSSANSPSASTTSAGTTATTTTAPTAPPAKPKLTKMEPPPPPTQSLSQPKDDSFLPSQLHHQQQPPSPDKRHRKKWSAEETQMLVEGCNIHGVGNWKTILADPNLTFDDRSPVDLKDRFRTYFPDAYRLHYPNAKTHLSQRVRATNPDGSSLFEKTRSKKRRPFTEEEDKALREGYEKHGCVWAQIVKDPVFQLSGRRSTDLRDRFRNAFPEEYERAGYKPRGAAKRKVSRDTTATPSTTPGSPVHQPLDLHGSDHAPLSIAPIRSTTADDTILSSNASSAGPVRRRRRAHTHSVLTLRGGTRSVPQSAAATDNESEEDSDRMVLKRAKTPPAPSQLLSPIVKDEEMMMTFSSLPPPQIVSVAPSTSSETSVPSQSSDRTHHRQWPAPPSGVDTPTTHSGLQGWAPSTPASPTSLPHRTTSQSQSPFTASTTMIGKSAWGPDWFSSNPRLDSGPGSVPSESSPGTSSRSYSVQAQGEMSPPSSSASPFSTFNNSLGDVSEYAGTGAYGGVMNRYDLLGNSLFHGVMNNPHAFHEYTSEIGVGDSFSDSDFNSGINETGGGMRGFTHHSNYAGDLMVGARTHQPIHAFNGTYSSLAPSGGLGLSIPPLGVDGPHTTGLVTPSLVPLSGIDDIELARISLEDASASSSSCQPLQEDTEMEDATSPVTHDSPPDVDQRRMKNAHMHGGQHRTATSAEDGGCLSLEDLVTLPGDDNDHMHATPPGTPHQSPRSVISSPLRGMRHSSYGMVSYPSHGSASSSAAQSRSISVPPSEARHPVLSRSSSNFITGATSQPDLPHGGNTSYLDHQRAQQQTAFSDPVFQSTSVVNPSTPVATPRHLLPPTIATTNESGSSSGESVNEIPFLDLHYSWNNGQMDIRQQVNRIQGQALDLASTPQSFSSAGAQLSILGNAPPAFTPSLPPPPPPLPSLPWHFSSGVPMQPTASMGITTSSSSSDLPNRTMTPMQGSPSQGNLGSNGGSGAAGSSGRLGSLPRPPQQPQPGGRPMSMTSFMKLSQSGSLARSYTLHSRGQSHGGLSMSAAAASGSIDPRDLMLSTGSELGNTSGGVSGMGKGKRASWDGNAAQV